VPGTADVRRIRNLGVGGSAKAAGALAATARAIQTALSGGHIAAGRVADFTAFAAECGTAALTFYDYAAAHPDGPVGSYATIGGIPNSMLWAEVELYLLTGVPAYKTEATARTTVLTLADLRATSYWDQRPLALAEFYPVADAATQTFIRHLLRQQADYFVSLADDTPYGVLDVFSNFGVNEPHAAYLADMVRYYELFGDQPALRAVLRGVNWIFGDNPWNISWVSGIGTDYVDFIHTRLDEQAYDHANTGIVLPGAMVSGPNCATRRIRPARARGTRTVHCGRTMCSSGATTSPLSASRPA
jgi:endoglucanase